MNFKIGDSVTVTGLHTYQFLKETGIVIDVIFDSYGNSFVLMELNRDQKRLFFESSTLSANVDVKTAS